MTEASISTGTGDEVISVATMMANTRGKLPARLRLNLQALHIGTAVGRHLKLKRPISYMEGRRSQNGQTQGRQNAVQH